jgi:hypothetical protein
MTSSFEEEMWEGTVKSLRMGIALGSAELALPILIVGVPELAPACRHQRPTVNSDLKLKNEARMLLETSTSITETRHGPRPREKLGLHKITNCEVLVANGGLTLDLVTRLVTHI